MVEEHGVRQGGRTGGASPEPSRHVISEWESFLDAGTALLPEHLHVTPELIRAIRSGRLPGLTAFAIPEEFTKVQKNRRVYRKDLRAGMVVGRDRKDIAGKLVVRRGDVLDAEAISAMERYGIPYLFVVVEHSLIKKSEVAERIRLPTKDRGRFQGVTLYVGAVPLRAPVAPVGVTGIALAGLLAAWYGAPPGLAIAAGTAIPLIALGVAIWLLRTSGGSETEGGATVPTGGSGPMDGLREAAGM